MKAGEFRQAIAELRQVAEAAPACDPDQYHLLAVAWLNLKSNENALAAAEQGIRVFPNSVPLQQYYVSLLSVVSSKQDAAMRLERALAMTPESVVYQRALGVVLLDLNPESERAGSLLSGAIRGSPHDVESRCYYAKWLCTMHREADAVRQLDQALEDRPDREVEANIYRLKAVAEDRLNHVDAARSAYEKAIELNRLAPKPGYAAELEYAEFWMRRSQDQRAKEVLRALLAHAPDLGLAHFDLARILAHANDFNAAIQEAGIALQYAPGIAEQKPIRILLIRTLHAAGRDEEAHVHQEWVDAH
jgi:tetratricopeptide (TPR) repeat protein